MGLKYKNPKGKVSLRDDNKNVYVPVYLKFNFSYLNKNCEKLTDKQSACLVKTLFYMSNRPFLQISKDHKSSGFETIPLKFFTKPNMGCPAESDTSAKFGTEDRKLSSKRDIIRIREIKTGRIIGKIYRNIFYVFYLDFKGEAYKH